MFSTTTMRDATDAWRAAAFFMTLAVVTSMEVYKATVNGMFRK
jgi:hypothetical protein